MADLGVLKSTPGGHDFLHDFSTTLQQMMGDLDFSTFRVSEESGCDENTFCTPDTIDQCISFLNQELLSLGFKALSYDNQTKMTCLINRLYQILRLFQRHGRTKEELENRLRRVTSECEHYQGTIARLKTEKEKLLRDMCVEQEKSRQLLVKHKTNSSKLKSEKEEVKRLLSVIRDRDTQYKHDLKKKERESNKLKERIHQLLADKTPNRRVGLDIAFSLQSSDGKRSQWRSTSNKQEEMYQHLMTGYEAKQKELLVENNELRTSLSHVHRDISKALGLSHHLTSHSAKVTTSPDSESCSSDEESNYPSVTDCSSNDIDGYFQMPYDMIRENLENMFKERLKRLKERKKRKLPSPTKSTKSSPSRLSTAKPYDMEQFKKEMEILKRQIKTYEEQIERHKREKENYKEVIQQQEDMIQNSIQTHKHQNSGEVFLDDSKLVQEKESLLEQKKLFHEEKTNFLEERKQFTEAAIKLGKERRALEEEKTTILKNQFLQISPFRSPTEKSTPQKDSVRLLPSTPLFSPAPLGQPKTPSTVELFRFLGITPQDQFLQHKNSTLDDSSSELKRSHSSEYLNNSTMTNSAHNDLSLFAGQLDSARKTLFHRRSSTGSNEDLGV